MASIETSAPDVLTGVDFGLLWLVVEPGIEFLKAAKGGYTIIWLVVVASGGVRLRRRRLWLPWNRRGSRTKIGHRGLGYVPRISRTRREAEN